MAAQRGTHVQERWQWIHLATLAAACCVRVLVSPTDDEEAEVTLCGVGARPAP